MRSAAGDMRYVQAEGEPEYWILRILRMKGRRKLPIQAWRCMRCGLLESYANGPST